MQTGAVDVERPDDARPDGGPPSVFSNSKGATMTRAHSSLADVGEALDELEDRVRRLPTASAHDVGPAMALVHGLRGRLRSEIAPRIVEPADADPRILTGEVRP
jgi:hypothetical protein